MIAPEEVVPRQRLPRRKLSRGLIAAVVALDLAIAIGVGFWVYFDERRFGAPTAPLELRARAETCAPDRCEEVSSKVMLTWAAPAYGGDVRRYTISRDGGEIGETDGPERRFVDRFVAPGEQPRYRVRAVGDEGTGPASVGVSTAVPLPPLRAATIDGGFDVEVVMRQVDGLDSYLGVEHPSAGDEVEEDWVFYSLCDADGCDVWLDEAELTREGATLTGTSPETARCSGEEVRSRETIDVEIVAAKVVSEEWHASSIEGRIETSFDCGSRTNPRRVDVHRPARNVIRSTIEIAGDRTTLLLYARPRGGRLPLVRGVGE